MKRGKHFTLLSFFSKRVGKISSLRRGINNRLKYFTIKMDLRTRNSRNLNLLQVFHELLYNAGYRDSRVLFAIHRFYPSPLQSFIRSRNVIRTPSPPNLSQKLLLLVMKLTVDCHASSLPWKGRTWTVVINFSTTLLDKRDFNTELQTLHPFILHLRDPCYLTSEENYTRFLFLRSFQRVLLFFSSANRCEKE